MSPEQDIQTDSADQPEALDAQALDQAAGGAIIQRVERSKPSSFHHSDFNAARETDETHANFHSSDFNA